MNFNPKLLPGLKSRIKSYMYLANLLFDRFCLRTFYKDRQINLCYVLVGIFIPHLWGVCEQFGYFLQSVIINIAHVCITNYKCISKHLITKIYIISRSCIFLLKKI